MSVPPGAQEPPARGPQGLGEAPADVPDFLAPGWTPPPAPVVGTSSSWTTPPPATPEPSRAASAPAGGTGEPAWAGPAGAGAPPPPGPGPWTRPQPAATPWPPPGQGFAPPAQGAMPDGQGPAWRTQGSLPPAGASAPTPAGRGPAPLTDGRTGAPVVPAPAASQLPDATSAPAPQHPPWSVLIACGVRHCLAPVQALLLSYAIAAALWMGAFMGLGMTLMATQPRAGSSSTSAGDASRITQMLLTAPVQLVGMALGGSVHGRIAISLGTMELRLTVCPVIVLTAYVLGCRRFARGRGRRNPVTSHREAFVAAAMAGVVAALVLALSCWLFGVSLSTHPGGAALVATTPRMIVQAWLVTFLVVAVQLLTTSTGLRPRPLVDLALRVCALLARFLLVLLLGGVVAGVVAAIALGGHRGGVYVVGTLFMGAFALGNAALAAASAALGGRVDAQFAYPFLHATHLSPGAPSWLAWALCLVTTLVACGLAGRRWGALRPASAPSWRGVAVPTWLLAPMAFLLFGGCAHLLLTASMALSAGRGVALGGLVHVSARGLLAWLLAGILVEACSRLPGRRGGAA